MAARQNLSGAAAPTLSASTSFTVGGNAAPAGTTGNAFPFTLINAPPAWYRVITYQSTGSKRWDLGTTGGGEPGGNAGSDFFLNGFADDGSTLIGTVFYATRASNKLTINNIESTAGTINGTAIGGTAPSSGAFSSLTAPTAAAGDNSTNVATTAFVNTAVDGVATLSTTGGTTTLTQAQYSAAVVIVTGALTSNAVLVVPSSGITTFINRTTGAFTLTVKTAAGTGVSVLQGYARNLVADGTNVVAEQSDFSGGRVEGSPVGAASPSTGAFTTLSASGTVSGAGFVALLAAPGPIGSTTPSTAAFTALTLGASAAAGSFAFNGPAGAARVTTFYTAGSKRWDVGTNGGSEAGSNLGSDFYWARYNDSGVVIDNPLTINRGSGIVAATSLATTAYLYASGATGLTAAGTTQATGYAINRSISVFTTVAAGAGATLPNVAPQSLSSTVMAEFTVTNAGANALLLYPASGLAINALAANAALSVAAGATVRGFQASTTSYRFG